MTTVFVALLYKFVNPPFTPMIVMMLSGQKFSGHKPGIKKIWVPLDSISYSLQLAAIAGEDYNFLGHHGFDFVAIKRAIEYNRLNKDKLMMGGSTISQQTAKNVFLWPQRSWIRKGLETYFTLLIELTWSKRRIMEVYLNVIETGPEMFGAEAASRLYFNKHASALTRSESALLVAILFSPFNYDPRKPTDYICWKKDQIIFYMSTICKYPIFPEH